LLFTGCAVLAYVMLQLRSSLETLEKLQLRLQGKEATGLQKGGLAKGNIRSCVTVGSDLVTMSYVQTAKRAWKSCKLRKISRGSRALLESSD
jgi:hypothetical protein